MIGFWKDFGVLAVAREVLSVRALLMLVVGVGVVGACRDVLIPQLLAANPGR